MPNPVTNNSEWKKFTPVKSKLRYNKYNELEIGMFLLELYQKALVLSEKELNNYFLDQAVNLTESSIGFFHFISEDQKSIILTAWNGEALKNCAATYNTHYPIEMAGNWVDCVRAKHPVIYNDFAKSPNQKGVPSGHVVVKRFMSIPIFDNEKVGIVFSVGNKTDPYNAGDVVQLQIIANELLKIYKQRQAENSLRESEKKYRSLFENMLDGFAFCKMIYDEHNNPVDFVYLEINNAFERLTGLKREAAVGKKITETIPGTEKANPELFRIYGRVALSCIEEKFEIFFKPLSKWFSIYAYCPQKGYFAAVFEDITERKKIEASLCESEVKFRTVANFTYDWESWIAPDGNLVYVSPSCERVTGYKAEEFIKDRELLTKIVHPEDKALINFHYEVVSSKELHDVDFRIVTRKGEVRWISHACQAVFDDEGKWLGRRSSNRDITERKIVEEKLGEYRKTLERLVEERTNELKDKERLAGIGQTAAMIGHDIRNPLQAIVSELFLAKQVMDEVPESKVKQETLESINIIQEQVDYINKIISDLQDYAKPLKPELVEVDICEAIPDVLKTIDFPNNIQTGAACETRIPKIELDLIFLRRIMTNLVNNAIQAMSDGGVLTVKASKKDEQIMIIVEDTGKGIPEDVKPKLFRPLFTTKAKGQGFGLPVVKRLVEAQGGTITFESQVGKGTKFIVRLPYQRAKQ